MIDVVYGDSSILCVAENSKIHTKKYSVENGNNFCLTLE